MQVQHQHNPKSPHNDLKSSKITYDGAHNPSNIDRRHASTLWDAKGFQVFHGYREPLTKPFGIVVSHRKTLKTFRLPCAYACIVAEMKPSGTILLASATVVFHFRPVIAEFFWLKAVTHPTLNDIDKNQFCKLVTSHLDIKEIPQSNTNALVFQYSKRPNSWRPSQS